MKQVYFAHSHLEYNTFKEAVELTQIKERWTKARILNPKVEISQVQEFVKLDEDGRVTTYLQPFFEAIDKCEVLVFTTQSEGRLGVGTCTETQYAIEKNIPVYLLHRGAFYSEETFHIVEIHENSDQQTINCGWAKVVWSGKLRHNALSLR